MGELRLKNKRTLIIIIVLGLLVLGGVLGIVLSVGPSDAFGGQRIEASRNFVPMELDIVRGNDGAIVPASWTTETVTVTVSGAPGNIGTGVWAHSMNPSVATVEVTRSGNRNTLHITARNGGDTRIRVTSHGGNQSIYIDVRVDVNARHWELTHDNRNGLAMMTSVTAETRLSLDESNFNFFAVSGVADTTFVTTRNEMTFSVSEAGFSIDTETNELVASPMSVGTAPRTVAVTANLYGQPARTFDVRVFSDFRDDRHTFTENGVLMRDEDRNIRGDHVVSLVKNDNVRFNDMSEVAINVTGWTTNAGTAQPRFGYELVNHDRTVVEDHLFTNNSFILIANGTGFAYVDVIIYPIMVVGGQTLRFNRPQDRHLQIVENIRVEVRNVFTEDIRIRTPHCDPAVADNEMFAFFMEFPFLAIEEQQQINIRQPFNVVMDGLNSPIINNVEGHPFNDRVTFDFNGTLPANIDYEIWELLHITFNPLVGIDTGFGRVMGEHDFNVAGVPYFSNFTIQVNPGMRQEIIQQLVTVDNLYLRVRSIAEINGVPLAEHQIRLSIARAMTGMFIEDEAGTIITNLLPVRTSTVGGGAFEFFVRAQTMGPMGVRDMTALEMDARFWHTRVDGFIVDFLGFTGDRARFSIRLDHTADVATGVEHTLTVQYQSGHAQTVSVELLEQLHRVEIGLDVVADGFIDTYTPVTFTNSSRRVSDAWVTIGGTYQLSVDAFSSRILPGNTIAERASISVEVTRVSGVDIGIDPNNFSFVASNEGHVRLRVDLVAPNSAVFPPAWGTTYFFIDLYVFNPITHAEVSRNWVEIFTQNSVSHIDGLPPVGSFVDVGIELNFDGTTPNPVTNQILINYIPLTSQAPHIRISDEGERDFRIYGLTQTDGFITVFFTVEQRVTLNGITRSFGFTMNRPLQFHVAVNRAATIQSITQTDDRDAIYMTLTGTPPSGTHRVNTNVFPAPHMVHDPRIGFAFVGDGNFNRNNREVRDNNNNLIASVGQNGVIEARHSNVGQHAREDRNVTLIIFAYDSIRNINGVLTPTVYLKLDVFIFNQGEGAQQFFISTLDEFTQHFGFVERAPRQLNTQTFRWFESTRDIPYGSYFRLIDNIDFSGVALQPIRLFNGTFTGTRSLSTVGGTVVRNFELQNMNIVESTHVTGPIGNLVGTPITMHGTNWGHATGIAGNPRFQNYGLFERIGAQGVVDGVSFTQVNVASEFDRLRTVGQLAPQINFGVLAAINDGTIRDVSVDIGFGNFNMVNGLTGGGAWGNGFERLNIGAIVGLNRHIIEEVNLLTTSGTLRVNHTRENATQQQQGYAFHINMGAIAGVNDGTGRIIGRTGTRMDGDVVEREGLPAGLFNEVVIHNSEMNLIYLANSTYVRVGAPHFVQKNVGGIVGLNSGELSGVTSQAVLFNGTRGAIGGLAGTNNGNINNSYSTSAIYARGVIGGLVGRNAGTVSDSYFDLYVNAVIIERLQVMLQNNPTVRAYWAASGLPENAYVGIMVGQDINGAAAADISTNTIVGGVIGVNSGHVTRSFATSIFSNESFGAGSVLGATYLGDIAIMGARGSTSNNVIVGGVIGRQEGTALSNITGVYSRLVINYDSLGIARNPIIGGLIGEIAAGASANIVASFSQNHYRLRTNSGETAVVSAVVGRSLLATTNAVNFTISYSVMSAANVDWVTRGTTTPQITTWQHEVGTGNNPTFTAQRRAFGFNATDRLNVNSGTLAGWSGGAHNAANYFINQGNINIPGDTINLATDLGSAFPVLRSATGATVTFNAGRRIAWEHATLTNVPVGSRPTTPAWVAGTWPLREFPLGVARPRQITLTIRSQSEIEQTFGAVRNTRGGFNFVVPAESNAANPANQAAALFFSNGRTQQSSIMANRYYLDQVFGTHIIPLIAARRVHIRLENNTAGAVLGVRHEDGVPLHFVTVGGLGSFTLVATSTRHDVDLPELAQARIHFDVVPSVSLATVSREGFGLVGQRSLLTGDIDNFEHSNRTNITPVGLGPIPVQRGVGMVMAGAIDHSAWSVYTTRTRDIANAPNRNGERFYPTHVAAAGAVAYSFTFTPYIEVGNRVYRLRSAETQIDLIVDMGAIYLDMRQDANQIDGTTAAIFHGRFVTDVAPQIHTSHITELARRVGLPVTHPERISTQERDRLISHLQLLSLLHLTFDSENDTHDLFGDPREADFDLDNALVERINVSGGNRRFSLIFTLELEGEPNRNYIPSHLTIPSDSYLYTEYRFNVFLRIEVDMSVYQDVMGTNPVTMPTGISGILHAAERGLHTNQGQWVNFHRLLYAQSWCNDEGGWIAGVPVEVRGQSLQTVTVQHYSSTTRDGVDPITELRLEDLTQSMTVFSDTELHGVPGGLLMLHAQPLFANIKSFNIRSEPVSRRAGPGANDYKTWDIEFVQMVRTPPRAIDGVETRDVFQNPTLGSVEVDGFPGVFSMNQISSTVFADGNWRYAWDGVWYIQTYLRTLHNPTGSTMMLEPGVPFNITVEIVTGEVGAEPITITRRFTLYSQDRPSLYFYYDGPMTRESVQAVGTRHPFTMVPRGDIEAGWEDRFSVYEDGALVYGWNALNNSFVTTRNNIWVERQDDSREYYLVVAPQVPLDQRIDVLFHYRRIDANGQSLPFDPNEFFTSHLRITAMLYRITDITLNNVWGNNINLRNTAQRDMYLNVHTISYAIAELHYMGGTPSEDTLASNGRNLLEFIDERVVAIQNTINTDGRNHDGELMDWFGRCEDGVSHLLNSMAWRSTDANDGRYLNPIGPQTDIYTRQTLNFHLGVNHETGHRFMMASSFLPRTNSLRIDMYFRTGGGIYHLAPSGTTQRRMTVSVNIISLMESSEQRPTVIRNRDELMWLSDPARANDHFILMFPIDPNTGRHELRLTNWRPMPFHAASLDGNNQIITINSFDLSPRQVGDQWGTQVTRPNNIGLFSEIMTDRVVMNLNIIIANIGTMTHSSLMVNLRGYPSNAPTINVGVLAGVNNGIVTNVAILSAHQFEGGERNGHIADLRRSSFDQGVAGGGRARARLSVIVNDSNTSNNVNVGGLIGENRATAVVSNSRVLVDIYFGDIEEGTAAGERNINQVWVGGFAGRNYGYIVSSFFRDANILNFGRPIVAAGARSYTAGFVARNMASGVIRASYVMGASNSLDARGSVTRGRISSFDISAGFVYENMGLIEDAYVNILQTQSYRRNGFVERSTGGEAAVIRNSFVNIPYMPAATRGGFWPFTYNPGGILVNQINFVNNKFFIPDTGGLQPGFSMPDFVLVTLPNLAGTELQMEYNMRDQFAGFSLSHFDEVVFHSNPNYPITAPNIWRMTQFGPRLVSADHIAVSIRIEMSDGLIVDAPGFTRGESIRNPIVIWNGDQFNRYLYENSNFTMYQDQRRRDDSTFRIDWERNVYQGYLRLVNNVSLSQGPGGDLESHDGLLHTYKVIFGGDLDGNGLNMRYISIDATEAYGDMFQDNLLPSVGLFQKLEYATVKNINLRFVPHFTEPAQNSIIATNARYVGGLAGIAINSNIVDVNVINQNDAPNARIQGGNIVGGVVGVVVQFKYSDSPRRVKIENVHANLPVQSITGDDEVSHDFNDADSYVRLGFENQGIAGGVIGLITHDVRSRVWRNDADSTVDLIDNDAELFMKGRNGLPPFGNVLPIESSRLRPNVRNVGNYRSAGGRATHAMAVEAEIVGGLIGVVENPIIVSGADYWFTNHRNAAGALISIGFADPNVGLARNYLRGRFYVGGLIGINFGRIYDSRIDINQLNVQSATDFDSDNPHEYYISRGPDGSGISGHGPRLFGLTVGGAVGSNAGIVTNVSSDVAMNSSTAAVQSGGFAGRMEPPVLFQHIAVVGGLVGENVGGATMGGGRFGGEIIGGEVHRVVRGGFYLGGVVGINRAAAHVGATGGQIANVTLHSAVFGATGTPYTILWSLTQTAAGYPRVSHAFYRPESFNGNTGDILNPGDFNVNVEFNTLPPPRPNMLLDFPGFGNQRRFFTGTVIGFIAHGAPPIDINTNTRPAEFQNIQTVGVIVAI